MESRERIMGRDRDQPPALCRWKYSRVPPTRVVIAVVAVLAVAVLAVVLVVTGVACSAAKGQHNDQCHAGAVVQHGLCAVVCGVIKKVTATMERVCLVLQAVSQFTREPIECQTQETQEAIDQDMWVVYRTSLIWKVHKVVAAKE
jgi:hypothetical protein